MKKKSYHDSRLQMLGQKVEAEKREALPTDGRIHGNLSRSFWIRRNPKLLQRNGMYRSNTHWR